MTTPIFLSRLVLDPNARSVAADVSDCHALHRRVMQAFAEAPEGASPRDHFGVLHRVDIGALERPELIVQAAVVPSWVHLPNGYLASDAAPPVCKNVAERYATIEAGMRLRFRLRANPTRKIDTKSVDGVRRNGRRVELTREPEQLAWLHRKGVASGFEIDESVGGVAWTSGKSTSHGSGRGRRLTFASVTFDGVLVVKDPDQFRQALIAGIGTAKAFGFGLLSIARA